MSESAFVYVDIWDQIKDAYMLPDLIDPGLNGALGACVSERVAQIKLCQSSDLIMDPDQCGTQLSLPKVGDGIFDIKLRTGAQLEDKCDPCADLVDISLTTSNLLFRVEIHDIRYDETGFPLEVQLKWSRENGAITYKVPPSGTALPQLDKSFAYEFFNEETEQNMGMPAGGYSHQPERGEIVTDPADRPQKATHYRRWDGFARIDLMTDALESGWDRGVGLSKTAAGSEHGRFGVVKGAYVINLSEFVISLDLVDRDILVGDFWMALARSNAPEGEKIRVLSERPLGIHHHYCYLGELIMEEEDSYIRIDQPEDKSRLEFPDLTCLHASDIAYMPHECDKLQDVDNMQDALDALCQAIPEYHTLKMSCGTGQSGYLGEKFESKIKVLVEDQHGRPVRDRPVRFTCDTPKTQGALGGPQGFLTDSIREIQDDASRISDNADTPVENPTAPQPYTYSGAVDILHSDEGDGYQLIVKTDDMGYACVEWTPQTIEGPRSVRVELVNAPQGLSGALYFCGFAKHKDPEKPVLPKLKGVFWLSDRKTYHNDKTVELARVLKGFELHFTEALRKGPDYRNAFRLFIDFVRENRGSAIETVEVCSEIRTNTNRLIIEPNQAGVKDIAEANGVTDCLPRGYRFRMELDGRFIFAQTGENIDAFVPTTPTSDNKYIALDWNDAGLGHVSDFKSWFYLAIKEPDPVKEIPINTVKAEELSQARLFNGNEAARLLQNQPHWQRHAEIFEVLKISDRGRMADIQTQIIFDGYKPRPKKHDVSINISNIEQLYATALFTDIQLEKIIADQPHWESTEQLVKKLSISGTKKRQTLETRLNFNGYQKPIQPVKKDVFVNKASEAQLTKTKLFSEKEIRIISKNKPRWKDLNQLLLAIGITAIRDIKTRDRVNTLNARISFDGYQAIISPKKDILVNKMTEEQLVNTKLFSRLQAAQIVKSQPHWDNEKILFERLKITNSRTKFILSPRLNFDGFRKIVLADPKVFDDRLVDIKRPVFDPKLKVVKNPAVINPVVIKPAVLKNFPVKPTPAKADTRKQDVKVNIFNLDQLVKSGVFNKTEAAKILARRPQWQNVKQVLSLLKITDASKVAILEKRLNFEGFGKGVPVKETPKVSINKGTEKELLSVPGIRSRTLVKRIIAARPYRKIEELKKAGLRSAQINKMKPHLKL